ncbi:MAG: alpha-amylase [Eubacteriales bacterium]|nr:alpha-amylase [Eubacteriales bacterium]
MAVQTSKALRNQVMYSVYVRQFSREGTFAKVREALPRIRALGVDVLWLLPIHPVGEQSRKGTLGSPYAIRDYRAVNPEFGTLEDFRALVDAIHAQGMKCIIDVVYNHTSPDSVLSREHPEWFYHKPDGSFGNRIGEWSDIIDLDYIQQDLWAYQIETLRQWAKIVDGFRCDVAPLIPLAFWLAAREAVEAVRPDCLWLSESVEPAFIVDNRARGMVSLSDSEIYQAFDISYEYDIYGDFMGYLRGESTLQAYAEAINRQEHIYPDNFVKLRFLENHDRPRAAQIIPDARQRRNWTAFLYFQKGMTLLYNGQETENTFRPSLFDPNPIRWDTGRDIAPLLQCLYRIKQRAVFTDSAYRVRDAGNGILAAEHRSGARRALGVFSTRGCAAPVAVNWADGVYVNLIDDRRLPVENGLLSCDGEPIILASDEGV